VTTLDQQFALAAHYLEVRRPGEALRILDDAPSEALGEGIYWLLRARGCFELDRWDEGIEAAQRGLVLDPEDTDLLNILALCQLEGGHEGDADKTLFRALAIEPENPTLLANRALVLARELEFPEARMLVEKAATQAPRSAHVATVRVQVAMLAGDPGAQRLVDDLMAQDPENEVAHALQGNLASRNKQYVAASRAFDEAARLDPGNESLVGTARRARVAAHPLLAPLRLIWRVGWFPARVGLLVVFLGLNAAGFHTLAEVVIVAWFALLVFSWTAPRYLRWRMKRRYGDF
jgi:Tfp pilus assembly protein PilF